MAIVVGFKPLSLRHNIAWTWVGNGLYMACQWALLMALAKIGTKELVGQFSMGMAITAPIMIFFHMQLRPVLVTDVAEENIFSDFLWTRLFAVLVAIAVIGAVMLLGGYARQMNWIIALIGLAKAVEALSDMAYARMQKFERMDFIAISMMIRGAATLIVFVALLAALQSLIAALSGMVAVWSIMLLLFDIPFSLKVAPLKESLFAVRRVSMIRLFWTSLPLALMGGLSSFSTNIPRYFLDNYQGKASVAMFAVASAPLAFLSLFRDAIGQAASARAAMLMQKGQKRALNILIMKLTGITFIASAAFTLAFAVFGERLLSILFTAEYKAANPILVVIASGFTIGSLATFGLTVLPAARKFWLQFIHVVVLAFIQIGACVVLIAGKGVAGAAWCEFIRNIASLIILNGMGLMVFLRFKQDAMSPLMKASEAGLEGIVE